MPDRAFLLASFLRPLFASAGMFLIAGLLWLIWTKFPEGKLKRLLLFNLWGGKNDPWVKAYKRKPTDSETVEVQVIHPVQSGNPLPKADPEKRQ